MSPTAVAFIVLPVLVILVVFTLLLVVLRRRASSRTDEPLGWKTSVRFRRLRR